MSFLQCGRTLPSTMPFFSNRRCAVFLLLALVFGSQTGRVFASVTLSQPSNEEGAAPLPATLTGHVQDPTGAIISGAEVQLLNAKDAVISSAQTDGAGQFRISQPQPGQYRLTVELTSFESLTLPLVVPANGHIAPLVLTLKLAGIATNVNVEANDAIVPISPDQNGDVTGISSDDMKSLPLFDDDPVATLTAMLDAGAAGEGGATLIVDGVEVKTTGVSPSAIQNVSINQDPYSARFRQPGRGQIEITTRSTTDKFHGSVNFTFRDAALNASNYFATVKPPEQRRIYEGYLTGPIHGLPHTAFLFSLNRREEDVFAQVNAQVLVPDPNNPGESIVSTLNESSPAPTRRTGLTMKVSHQFSERNFGFVLYQFYDGSQTNQSVGGIVLPSAGYIDRQLDQNIVFHDDFAFSPNKLNQFSFLFEDNYDTTTSIQHAQQIIVQGAATFGGGQADTVESEFNPNISDIFSWTVGRHQIKFGVQLPNMGRRILEDRTNRLGTYTFASLTDYEANKPSSFAIQEGQERFLTHYLQPSGFVLDEFQLTPRLTVTPGLRYDWQNALPDTKNAFEPRLSVAYLLDKTHAMVLRTGGGIYFRRVGVNIGQQLARYENAAERSLIVTNPCYPDISVVSTTCNGLSEQPPNLFNFVPGIKSPVQAYYGMSLERQLNKNSTLTVSYGGYRGWHALLSVDVNAPLPPAYNPLLRPDPTHGQILQQQSGGYQKSDSLAVNWRGRFGSSFSGMMQYTLSHSDSDTTFSTFIPSNQFDPKAEWSRSDWDQRRRLYLLGTFFPAKLYNLGIGFSANTPEPYTITTGADTYDPGVYTARPVGVPRNSLNAGGSRTVDLRWGYNLKLRPDKKDDSPTLGFSAASFNTFNEVNYASYIGIITSPSFMKPTQAFAPRRLQLGASFNF